SGSRYLLSRNPRAAWIVLSAVAATAVFLTFVRLTDFYFYHRFILVSAVPLLLLAGIGLSRLRLPLAGVGAVGIFGFLTFPQTRLLTTRSYAPFRETVADIRDQASKMKGEVIPVGYGLGSHVMQCYFPQLRDIRSDSRQKLQSLIDQARKEDRPLIVALGYEGLNRLNQPEGFALLDDPALFQKISTRHGIEPEFTFHLFSLRPPAAGAVTPAAPAGRPDPPD
ncbi:MAG: hypothetical protein JWL81_683, partial [Verrucomicrobiales bacterium]|nr:hypothetical protein [Verrucomicrobiales bacterium]